MTSEKGTMAIFTQQIGVELWENSWFKQQNLEFTQEWLSFLQFNQRIGI